MVCAATHLHPRVCRSPTPGYICYPCVSLNILWERNPPLVSNILPLIIAVSFARWTTSLAGLVVVGAGNSPSDSRRGCSRRSTSTRGRRERARFPELRPRGAAREIPARREDHQRWSNPAHLDSIRHDRPYEVQFNLQPHGRGRLPNGAPLIC